MKYKYLILFFLIFFFIGLGKAIITINDWYNSHYFKFSFPIVINIVPPIEIKQREPQIIEKKVTLDYPFPIDTPLEKYICDKFGPFDCKTALAISKAENRDRIRDKVNINSNGTIDVGIFQINSVHFSKEGCALYQIVDPIQNVDCAKKIFDEQSWKPWVTFNTGSYLAHLQ